MARFAMPAASREESRRGIFYMIAAVFVFSAVNALVKWLVETYPLGEVIFFRCLFALAPALCLVAASGGVAVLRTSRLPEHAGRAFLQFLSMLSIFTAFGLMPLADAVGITFSGPIFMTVLAVPLLGEKVGVHRWGAVLAGFLGILLMVQPGPGIVEGGALFALFNALVSASVTIAIRRMSLTEATATLVFYQALITFCLSLLLLPFGWAMPGWRDAGLLALVGLASGCGQYLWTQAFRLAPAAVAAPFSYTSMIWALLFGFALWGDLPGPAILGGATVVITAGCYILWRETVRGAPIVRQPQT